MKVSKCCDLGNHADDAALKGLWQIGAMTSWTQFISTSVLEPRSLGPQPVLEVG